MSDELNRSGERDAGCIECGRDVDRVLPEPIPEGHECMWSEAMTGRALYCGLCFNAFTPGSAGEPA